MLGVARTARHLIEALPDDPQALADLFHVHRRPVEAIAGPSSGYVEIELFVAGIGLFLPCVPCEAASAEIGSGHAPLDRFLNRAAADALRTRLKQAVPYHRTIVF